MKFILRWSGPKKYLLDLLNSFNDVVYIYTIALGEMNE